MKKQTIVKINEPKRPWFFTAQDEADKELRKQFEHVTYDFQVVSEPRVFNQLTCWNDADKEPTQIMMVITKHGTRASIILWNLHYRQGWSHNNDFSLFGKVI